MSDFDDALLPDDDALLPEDDDGASLHTATVAADDDGRRLDKWLAGALPGLSRSRLKALILDGRVSRDGQTISDPNTPVKPGQQYSVAEPPPAPATPQPQDIPLTIVYEDDDLLVVDKPAGMTVHPAPGSPDGTLVNALLHHCGDSLSGIGGVARPGIVHRIDKDTSGLMVVAKTDLAHQGLSAQFAAHSLERAYQAVVWGVPAPPHGTVEGPIGRHPVQRKKMAVVHRGGKPAVTRYKVLRAFGLRAALIECRLETGRTHQIRVHMTESGHPLIGDPVYGRARPAALKDCPEAARQAVLSFPRQALHAYLIGFDHPRSGKTLRFQINLPLDISNLIYSLEC